MKQLRSCCYSGNILERKRFLSITAVRSMVCGGVVLLGTSGSAFFPLKKRYSPSIFQKEMLDKRFTNRVNTTLTKNVTVHGFAVASFTVGGDVTGSGPVAAVAGCWGGRRSSLPFRGIVRLHGTGARFARWPRPRVPPLARRKLICLNSS